MAQLGGSNRMLSASEVAAMLGKHPDTIYTSWREYGLKAYRIGKSLKFRERDLEAWLEENVAR